MTDPAALGSIMGRGEHAVDKAFETYAPINKMCDPHGQVRIRVRGGMRVAACGTLLAPSTNKQFVCFLSLCDLLADCLLLCAPNS